MEVKILAFRVAIRVRVRCTPHRRLNIRVRLMVAVRFRASVWVSLGCVLRLVLGVGVTHLKPNPNLLLEWFSSE